MNSLSLGGWGKGYHRNYYDLSLHVAPINESIDIIARAFSSGVPYLEDENGERTQDDAFIEFILKPNKEQNYKEFSKEFIRNLFSGGYSYLYPYSDNEAYVRRLDQLMSENRPELFVLNNDYIEYPNDEIGEFIYSYKNTQSTKFFENVLPFWDEVQDPCNYRVGVSRLCSLKDEIDNIILANRAKTNKIRQSGKFLATPKSSGLTNQIGMQLDQPVNLKDPSYKQRDFIEDKLEHTGLAGGKSITVTNKEMAVMNVMESIQDYSYDEEVKEDKRTIKNTFGIPRELQNIGDDVAKYENRKEAMSELFNILILPLATNFTETIQSHYIPDDNRKFVLDFSHHPAFEIAKMKEEQRMTSQVDRLVMLYEKGIITVNELQEQLRSYEII